MRNGANMNREKLQPTKCENAVLKTPAKKAK
jgi:hypothetical protein